MNNRIIYIILLALSAIMTGLTVAVSVMGTAGTSDSLFTSPFIVFIFAAYVAIQIICIFKIRGKLTLYRVGFYVLHVGLVLLLVGMFIYYISGDKLTSVTVPVSDATYNKISRATDSDEETGETVELPFYLGITDFKVDEYEDGTDKYYEANLKLVQKGVEEANYQKLTVNHPVTVEGWKIYLMSYVADSDETIVYIMLKYNPGEYVILSGIWMAIIGSFMMCLMRKRGAK